MTAPLAILRSVPDSFARAIRSDAAATIDVAAARAQHDAYRRALEAGGFATMVIPADEAHPDSPFIEDTAVVLGSRGLLTRPGHPDRRGEVDAVAAALGEYLPVHATKPPATLDGGDVLRVGRSVFVGLSQRTNREGVAAVTAFVAPAGLRVIPVEVRNGLHLKSAVTALDDATVLVWPGAVDLDAFTGLEILPVGSDDPHAANVVRLPDGRILTAGTSEDLIMALAYRGQATVAVDVSEFAKADGGVTCLSVRLR